MMQDRFGECLGKDIFALVLEDNRELIYAPLIGMALIVNTSYRKLLVRALQGDIKARHDLGLDHDTVLSLGSSQFHLNNPVNESPLPDPLEPSPLTLFLTNTCTMRCRYCYAGDAKARTMPKRMVENMIERAVTQTCRIGKSDHFALNIHGRDVGACWPLFVHTMEFAKGICHEKGLKLQTTMGTNAVYNQKQIEYIAANITGATVSIDGTPKVHDAYRILAHGGPSSKKVLRTLSEFDRLGFNYSVRMTVLEDTVEDLPESVAFVLAHTRAKKIKVEPLYMRGHALHSCLRPPEPHRFVEFFIKAQGLAHKKNVELSYSGARSGIVTKTFCSACQPIFGVTPEGYLTACYEVLDHHDPLSDYFIYGQYDPAKDGLTVQRDVVTKLRKATSDRLESCGDCFCKWSCGGDCPAKFLLTQTSDSDSIPDRCIITRALTKHQVLSSL
ncbi:MAG: radical SAM protein [Proteobacteria bacterium]|nr:radical SAM protein [Pseudomonadota bacterium]